MLADSDSLSGWYANIANTKQRSNGWWKKVKYLCSQLMGKLFAKGHKTL